MQKRTFVKLAVLGILCGSLSHPLLSAADKEAAKNNTNDLLSTEDGNMGYHLMTEDELLLELDTDTAKIYQGLSPENKQLALKVASARCNGTNECAGLNACKTDKNDCAGQGKCKGLGKCAFSDKNLAVKAVAKKVADKRAKL